MSVLLIISAILYFISSFSNLYTKPLRITIYLIIYSIFFVIFIISAYLFASTIYENNDVYVSKRQEKFCSHQFNKTRQEAKFIPQYDNIPSGVKTNYTYEDQNENEIKNLEDYTDFLLNQQNSKGDESE
ncbi:MAG: hypothetical protein ACFFAO_19625 [Candidatus Hermodarchaeota archaeon]